MPVLAFLKSSSPLSSVQILLRQSEGMAKMKPVGPAIGAPGGRSSAVQHPFLTFLRPRVNV